MDENDLNYKQDELNAKQSMFVIEYIKDFNATQAAIRAGYSKDTAAMIGYENLRKPYIQAAIALQLKAREARTLVTADRIVHELAKIAFHDPRKFFDDQGELINPASLDDDTASALSSFEVKESDSGTTFKIKSYDKTKALDMLMKHVGAYSPTETIVKVAPDIPNDQMGAAKAYQDFIAGK